MGERAGGRLLERLDEEVDEGAFLGKVLPGQVVFSRRVSLEVDEREKVVTRKIGELPRRGCYAHCVCVDAIRSNRLLVEGDSSWPGLRGRAGRYRHQVHANEPRLRKACGSQDRGREIEQANRRVYATYFRARETNQQGNT